MNQLNSKLSFFYDGFVLAIQFLTIIPLKKEVPWDRNRAKMCVRSFPLVGLVLGFLMAPQAYLLIEYSPFSIVAIAFWLFCFSFFFSGGLHLDGWMDCSDAYFSYRDQERRLEIMKDSRVGAFGVLSVLFLLGWRFLFFYEVLHTGHQYIYVVLLVIPFFSRMIMGELLICGQLARNEGMAFAFREHVAKKDISYYGIYLLLFIMGLIFFVGFELIILILLLFMTSIAFYFLYLRFITQSFGGVTGDTLGASVEGGGDVALANPVAITLLRHGLTAFNLEKRYLGWTDIPLHPMGIQKLKELKKRGHYPEGDYCFVSDLTRCKQTHELLYPSKKMIVDAGLREYNFGIWEGLTYEELKDQPAYVDWLNHYKGKKPPDGELYGDFQERVLRVWRRIIILLENPETNHIVVVSHGGPIRLLLSMFAPEEKNMWEWSIDFGSGYTMFGERSIIRRGERCTSLQAVPLMEKGNGSIISMD